jgi:hypothetical protein
MVPDAEVLQKGCFARAVSKSDSVACRRCRLLFWLSEGISAMSREKKERCCDEKLYLVWCMDQIDR